MDFEQMQARAREIRTRYAEVEASTYGRSWTTEEIMLGFLGDVGDLAKLVQGKAGVRPREDLDEALAHELADCLWSVLTLANAYDVDLVGAFTSTMDELDEALSAPDLTPPRRPDGFPLERVEVHHLGSRSTLGPG